MGQPLSSGPPEATRHQGSWLPHQGPYHGLEAAGDGAAALASAEWSPTAAAAYPTAGVEFVNGYRIEPTEETKKDAA